MTAFVCALECLSLKAYAWAHVYLTADACVTADAYVMVADVTLIHSDPAYATVH